MDKYLQSQFDSLSPSFDTSQFSELELVGALRHFEQTRQVIINNIGIGGSILSVVPPTIHEGRVYFGACDRRLYCLDFKGREMWNFKADDIIFNPPNIVKDTAYATSYDGNLYALEAGTGQLKWKFHTNDKIFGKVIVIEGKIIVGSFDGNIYCLNEQGKHVWTTKTNSPVTSAFRIQEESMWNGWIFFCSFDGKLFPIDLKGKIPWTFVTRGTYTTLVHVYNDKVYFGSQDRYLYCLDCKTGKVIWKFPMGDTSYVHSIADNVLYGTSRDYNIYALDSETGKLLWKFSTKGMVWGSGHPPENGVLYVGSNDKHVYALDSKKGTLVWKFQVQGPIWHGPAIEEDKLFFGSYDCNFYCLNLKGELQWKFPTSMSSPSPIDTGESSAAATLTMTLASQEKEEEKDRYKSEFTDQGGPTSQYIVKSKYVVESKYTKQRKIKSMSSGWED